MNNTHTLLANLLSSAYIPMTIDSNGEVGLPLYHAQDANGNIYYDTNSIDEAFQVLMQKLNKLNENSNFDWDNI